MSIYTLDEAQVELEKWGVREDSNFAGVAEEEAKISAIAGRELSRPELWAIVASVNRIQTLEEGIERIQDQYNYYYRIVQDLAKGQK